MKFSKKILLFVLICLFACQDDNNIENGNPNQSTQKEHFISATEAIKIALNGSSAIGTKSTEVSSSKMLGTIDEMLDSLYIPLYYVINFKNNGFAIVAADNRITSILAYSDRNSFPAITEDSPEALREWLNSIERKIVNIRYFKGGMDKIVSGDTIKTPKPDPPGLSGGYPGGITGGNTESTPTDPFNRLYVAPFIETRWTQNKGFNRLLPICNDSERVPAGCVAVAMAQIMKYYGYPASYSWNTMPIDSSSSESAKLIRDIGEAVHMDYDCSGSSADTRTDVVPAFLNTFGYSSAKYSGFNAGIVKSNLAAKMPVIFRGGRKKEIMGIFPKYVDGHAWVCCGFNETYTEIPPGKLAEEGEKW